MISNKAMKLEKARAVMVLVAVIIVIVVGGIPQAEKSEEPLDTQSLSLDALGCVATTPDVQPLKKAFAEGLKTVPKGTTFTAQCFGR